MEQMLENFFSESYEDVFSSETSPSVHSIESPEFLASTPLYEGVGVDLFSKYMVEFEGPKDPFNLAVPEQIFVPPSKGEDHVTVPLALTPFGSLETQENDTLIAQNTEHWWTTQEFSPASEESTVSQQRQQNRQHQDQQELENRYQPPPPPVETTTTSDQQENQQEIYAMREVIIPTPAQEPEQQLIFMEPENQNQKQLEYGRQKKRKASADISNSNDHPEAEDDERKLNKRARQLENNRAAAKKSRQKKKSALEKLNARCEELQILNDLHRQNLEEVYKEFFNLRSQIMYANTPKKPRGRKRNISIDSSIGQTESGTVEDPTLLQNSNNVNFIVSNAPKSSNVMNRIPAFDNGQFDPTQITYNNPFICASTSNNKNLSSASMVDITTVNTTSKENEQSIYSSNHHIPSATSRRASYAAADVCSLPYQTTINSSDNSSSTINNNLYAAPASAQNNQLNAISTVQASLTRNFTMPPQQTMIAQQELSSSPQANNPQMNTNIPSINDNFMINSDVQNLPMPNSTNLRGLD
ncbi:5006_t:CDS:2 [Ambispora leptoticha]|uniref:5006_t:CDS:1 n=1 Tax=Ambispora leptoticha TaxID=144679 RepID=A0A9N8ZIA5_9GLOM|nr:5006_t:CDS:2 [Ambispora leptoticha]